MFFKLFLDFFYVIFVVNNIIVREKNDIAERIVYTEISVNADTTCGRFDNDDFAVIFFDLSFTVFVALTDDNGIAFNAHFFK